jgi:hypothetical protein
MYSLHCASTFNDNGVHQYRDALMHHVRKAENQLSLGILRRHGSSGHCEPSKIAAVCGVSWEVRGTHVHGVLAPAPDVGTVPYGQAPASTCDACRRIYPHLSLKPDYLVAFVLPSIQPPPVQCEYICLRQYMHLPKDMMHEMNTRSPRLKVVTDEPTSWTTPTPS